MNDCREISLRRDESIRGVKLAGLIVRGTLGPQAARNIPLTYLVPYLVSTYASVSVIRSAHDDAAN